MKNRKLWLLLGGIVLVLVLAVTPLMAGCAAPAEEEKPPVEDEKPPEEPIELVFTHWEQTTGTSCSTWYWWMDEVEKRTNGKVTFARYPATSLISAFEMLSALSRGTSDVSVLGAVFNPAELDFLSGMGIIMLTDYNVVLAQAATELFKTDPNLIEEARKNNIYYFTGHAAGVFHPITTKRITTLEDFQGLKTMAPGAFLAMAMEKLGAIPTVVEQAELYEAHERGLLDCGVYSISDAYSLRLYEICEYFTEVGLGAYGPFPGAFNLDTWNSLPQDVQQIILDLVPEEQRYYNDLLEQQSTEYAKTIREAGVIMQTLSPSDLQRFKDMGVAEACADVWVNLKPEQAQERRAYANRFMEAVNSIKVEPWMYSPAKYFE